MAPMLAVTFRLAETRLWYGILLLAYGVRHCAVIVLAGTFTESVQHYLNWNERSGGAVILRKICGVLVIPGSTSSSRCDAGPDRPGGYEPSTGQARRAMKEVRCAQRFT